MKRTFLPVALALSLALAACTPASNPAGNSGTPTTGTETPAAQINADAFNLMVLVAGEQGSVNPLTPESIAELKIDGKMIPTSAILQTGTPEAEALSKSESAQQERLKKIEAGEAAVIFGGSGIYSFFVPESENGNQVSIRLKDSDKTYMIERAQALSRGTMVLALDGSVDGAFDTREGFEVKVFNFGDIGSAFGDALGGGAFFNSTAFNPNNLPVLFTDEEDEEEVKARLNSQVATGTHPLTAFTGNWTLASDFLLGLIPGGQLEVSFRNVSENTYEGTAHLEFGSFSGQGTVEELQINNGSVTMNVSSQGKSVDLKLTSNGPNDISATLLNASDLPDVNAFVGTSVDLKRKL